MSFQDQHNLWCTVFAIALLMSVDAWGQTISVACDEPVKETYCYVNNEDLEILYTADDGSTALNIVFTAGGLQPLNDVIFIYDGDQIGDPFLYVGDGNGDMTGISASSTGPDMLMLMVSDDQVSCDDGAISPALSWTVSCVMPDELFDDRFELPVAVMGEK